VQDPGDPGGTTCQPQPGRARAAPAAHPYRPRASFPDATTRAARTGCQPQPGRARAAPAAHPYRPRASFPDATTRAARTGCQPQPGRARAAPAAHPYRVGASFPDAHNRDRRSPPRETGLRSPATDGEHVNVGPLAAALPRTSTRRCGSTGRGGSSCPPRGRAFAKWCSPWRCGEHVRRALSQPWRLDASGQRNTRTKRHRDDALLPSPCQSSARSTEC
jgi:hypothetical protein